MKQRFAIGSALLYLILELLVLLVGGENAPERYVNVSITINDVLFSNTHSTPVEMAHATSTASPTVSLQKNVCRLYPAPTSGICREFVGGKYIYPFNSHSRYLNWVEEGLSRIFSTITTMVSAIRHSSDKFTTALSFLQMYKMHNPSIGIPRKDAVRRSADLIASLTDACLTELLELYCRTYFPVCQLSNFSEVTYQQPCQQTCVHIRNVSCVGANQVLFLFWDAKVIEFIPCTFFQDYAAGASNCFLKNYTSSDKSSSSSLVTGPVLPPTTKDPHFSQSCPYYEDVLPDGYCKQIFRGKRIAQGQSFAQYSNTAVTIFYKNAVPLMLSIFGKSARRVKSLVYARLDGCKNSSFIEALLEKAVIPSEEEASYCFNLTKQYVCETYHPICLVDNGQKDALASGPCRESCQEFEKVCDSTLKVMRSINLLKTLCPKFNELNDRFFYVPHCKNFRKMDNKRMELCQMISMKAGEAEKRVAAECYYGSGTMYNGTVNYTESGQSCLPWSNYSFFNPNIYPGISEAANYCRNPQGYRKKPWCYVNITSMEWQYCRIDHCGDLRKSSALLSPSFWSKHGKKVLVATGCLAILILLTVIVRHYVHCKNKKLDAQKESSEIPPAYYIKLDLPGISHILKKLTNAPNAADKEREVDIPEMVTNDGEEPRVLYNRASETLEIINIHQASGVKKKHNPESVTNHPTESVSPLATDKNVTEVRIC